LNRKLEIRKQFFDNSAVKGREERKKIRIYCFIWKVKKVREKAREKFGEKGRY